MSARPRCTPISRNALPLEFDGCCVELLLEPPNHQHVPVADDLHAESVELRRGELALDLAGLEGGVEGRQEVVAQDLGFASGVPIDDGERRLRRWGAEEIHDHDGSPGAAQRRMVSQSAPGSAQVVQ